MLHNEPPGGEQLEYKSTSVVHMCDQSCSFDEKHPQTRKMTLKRLPIEFKKDPFFLKQACFDP